MQALRQRSLHYTQLQSFIQNPLPILFSRPTGQEHPASPILGWTIVFYYHEVLKVPGKGLGSSITGIIKIPPILAFLYRLVVKTTAGFKLMAQRSLPVKRMMLLLPSACSQGLVEFLSIWSCLYLKAQSALRL